MNGWEDREGGGRVAERHTGIAASNRRHWEAAGIFPLHLGF